MGLTRITDKVQAKLNPPNPVRFSVIGDVAEFWPLERSRGQREPISIEGRRDGIQHVPVRVALAETRMFEWSRAVPRMDGLDKVQLCTPIDEREMGGVLPVRMLLLSSDHAPQTNVVGVLYRCPLRVHEVVRRPKWSSEKDDYPDSDHR